MSISIIGVNLAILDVVDMQCIKIQLDIAKVDGIIVEYITKINRIYLE